jgi:hypothetical protein
MAPAEEIVGTCSDITGDRLTPFSVISKIKKVSLGKSSCEVFFPKAITQMELPLLW